MSDIENDDESILSENNNNINFIEDIENSYKTYINQLIDIIADILDKLTNKSNEESEKEKNEDENGEWILLSTTMIEMEIFNTNKIFNTHNWKRIFYDDKSYYNVIEIKLKELKYSTSKKIKISTLVNDKKNSCDSNSFILNDNYLISKNEPKEFINS